MSPKSTYNHVQETISSDVLIDKLLKARVPVNEIVTNLNTLLSTKRKFAEKDIVERLQKISKYQEKLGALSLIHI